MTVPGHILHESAEIPYSKTTFVSYHGQQDGGLIPNRSHLGHSGSYVRTYIYIHTYTYIHVSVAEWLAWLTSNCRRIGAIGSSPSNGLKPNSEAKKGFNPLCQCVYVYVCIVIPDIHTIHRCSHTSIHIHIHAIMHTYTCNHAYIYMQSCIHIRIYKTKHILMNGYIGMIKKERKKDVGL